VLYPSELRGRARLKKACPPTDSPAADYDGRAVKKIGLSLPRSHRRIQPSGRPSLSKLRGDFTATPLSCEGAMRGIRRLAYFCFAERKLPYEMFEGSPANDRRSAPPPIALSTPLRRNCATFTKTIMRMLRAPLAAIRSRDSAPRGGRFAAARSARAESPAEN
jgi:hypothetical protein